MRAPPSGIRRAVIAAALIGAGERIVLSLVSSGVTPVSDMAWYWRASRSIAAGLALAASTDRALLYPVVLGGLARAGLGSLAAVYLVQSALTLAAVAATAWYAARIAGTRAGWIAAALLAPQLTIAQYSGLLLSEALFLPLLAVWLALCAPDVLRGVERDARSAGRVAIAGLAAGCAGAVRPAAIPLAIGTCLALAIAGARTGDPERHAGGPTSLSKEPATRAAPHRAAPGTRARSVMLASVFALTSVLALVFVNAGAARIAGVPSSIAPTVGVNLYLGNGPGARLDGGGLSRLPEPLEAVEDPRVRNASAAREALREIVRRPVRAAWMGVVRLVRLASLNPGRVEHDALVRDGLPPAIALAWLGLEWLALVVLAVVGCRAGAVLRPARAFSILVAAPYALVLMLTFVQTRFRLPFVVLLAPFAAAGVSRILGTWDEPNGRRQILLAALAGIVVVLAATGFELALKRM